MADSKMTLEVANGTDRALELHVNGSKVAEIAAHGGVKLKANDLPDLPWDAVLHFAGGRRIVSLTVHSGDVHVLENSSRGIGARVDLSCGRIDLWSGPPVSGPPPGPGSPGDCNP